MAAKALTSVVNYCTAHILGDTERPRENESSPSRRLCRFFLTVLAVAGFTAAFAVFQLNQPPKRSQRVWITDADAADVEGFLNRMALQLNSIEWQCPCDATNVVMAPTTAAHLVDFFLVSGGAGVRRVESVDQFCGEVGGTRYFRGFEGACQEILTESFLWSGWDFASAKNLYMNLLRTGRLNPVSFMFDVCMSWAGALSQASSNYQISHFDSRVEDSARLRTFLRVLKTSLLTCAKHASWPPPAPALYLAEAQAAASDFEKLRYAVAIGFNWTHYFNMCAPSYCEHVKLNSSTWIVFSSLAQVGGFVSVALFALRSAVWPLVCIAFGWPSAAAGLSQPEAKAATAKAQPSFV